MKVSILYFTWCGSKKAADISEWYQQNGHTVSCEKCIENGLRSWSEHAFYASDLLIFVGACGIAVRAISGLPESKMTDPAVLCMDEQASFVIPLLSGHIGGANEYARELAEVVHATPVITTATDLHHQFAVDIWTTQNQLVIQNPSMIRRVSSKILNGELVTIASDYPIEGKWDPQCRSYTENAELPDIVISQKEPHAESLWCIPKNLIIGIGCKKGTTKETIERVCRDAMKKLHLPIAAVAAVTTVDQKADEAGLLLFCEEQKLNFYSYPAEELQKLKGMFSASDFVLQTVGCDNVCERSAMMIGNRLILPKFAKDGVTVAVAESHSVLSFQGNE